MLKTLQIQQATLLATSTLSYFSTMVHVFAQVLDRTLAREKPRYAVIDHILSQPAVQIPIKEAIGLCRLHGVTEVAVDGAHAIGNIPGGLDVSTLGADWYYSNLHKWGFAPHTCCLLHGSKVGRVTRLALAGSSRLAQRVEAARCGAPGRRSKL